MEARKTLSARTGFTEWWVMFMMAYTDDPVWITFGACRMSRLCVRWYKHNKDAGLIRSPPRKREIGVSMKWIGGKLFTSGLIAYIDDSKRTRTLLELRQALAGTLTVKEYLCLLGLLNHLVCIMALPYHYMYTVYEVVDKAKHHELGDSLPIGPLLTRRT